MLTVCETNYTPRGGRMTATAPAHKTIRKISKMSSKKHAADFLCVPNPQIDVSLTSRFKGDECAVLMLALSFKKEIFTEKYLFNEIKQQQHNSQRMAGR